jgi:hypothetical protein
MKKTLVATILGLATIAVVNAQSYVKLDTYNTPSYPAVTYGVGSGGPVGQPIADGGFTFGFYYAVGDQTAAMNASMPTGISIPGGPSILATGPGATTPSANGGHANSVASWLYSPTATANAQLSIVVVAWTGGADYASAPVRGHSQAFLYNAVYTGNGPAGGMDNFQGFQVLPVPEPSTFALAGLGLAGLLIFRRRK